MEREWERLSSLWFRLGLDLFIYRIYHIIYYIIIYYNTLYIIFIDILYNINIVVHINSIDYY